MTANDGFSHAPDPPSRSELRRAALAVFELAERLVALSEAQLAQVPMSVELRALVMASRRVTQHIARKRQTQYLAKHLRRREDELAPIEAALAHDRDSGRRETARQHRLEHWRDRLVAGGDDALSAYVATHPGADRQQLRQLVRRAQEEARQDKPPAAARELFRLLREQPDPDPAA
jgi:ribosome-associated protein